MTNFCFEKELFDSLVSDVIDTIKILSNNELKSIYLDLFHCIDHTTLHDEDNAQNVTDFCLKANKICEEFGTGSMASVCVYPEYASVAKKIVAQSGMNVAVVVGGFPTGQMPLPIKIQEIRYALDSGADEVDFVINRGIFLGGDYQHVAEEVAAARLHAGDDAILKVILETGQLQSPAFIYKASILALENGADFIKTSTGKTSIGATPEAAYAMLSAIKNFQKNSSRNIGFKVSGGVSTVDDALLYYFMTKKILGVNEINNHIFRIGTSRLVSELIKKL